MDINIESLVVDDAIGVVFVKVKELLINARKHSMQAMQVQMEIYISCAYLDSILVDSCVPSYNSLGAFLDSTRTSVRDVYREVDFVLHKEEAVIVPIMETNVLIVHPNLPLVIVVVRS